MGSRRRNSLRKTRKINQKKIIATAIAGAMIVIALVIVLVTSGGEKPVDFDINTATIFPGVTINSVDVGSMTMAEANNAVAQSETDKMNDFGITYVAENELFTLSAQDCAITSNLEDVLREAVMYGRKENGAEDKKITSELEKQSFNLDTKFTADQANITAAVAKICSEQLDKPAEEPSVEVYPNPETRFSYKEGSDGRQAEQSAMASEAMAQVEEGVYEKISVSFTTLKPTKTIDALKGQTQKITSFSTPVAKAGQNREERVKNIEKGASYINKYVLGAGETISLLEVVKLGKDYDPDDWALAPGFENGKTTLQPGGGICQVSSTFYVAAMQANMKIVEHRAHSMPVSYVSKGMDATIDSAGIDLKMKNDSDAPLYFFAAVDKTASGDTLTISVCGKPLEDGITLEMRTDVIETIPIPEPKITKDKEMAPGTRFEEQKGREGYRVETFLVKKDKNGNVYEDKRIYTTTYKAIAVQYADGPDDPNNPGKKTMVSEANRYKPLPTPTPTPTPSPSPSPSIDPTPPGDDNSSSGTGNGI